MRASSPWGNPTHFTITRTRRRAHLYSVVCSNKKLFFDLHTSVVFFFSPPLTHTSYSSPVHTLYCTPGGGHDSVSFLLLRGAAGMLFPVPEGAFADLPVPFGGDVGRALAGGTELYCDPEYDAGGRVCGLLSLCTWYCDCTFLLGLPLSFTGCWYGCCCE